MNAGKGKLARRMKEILVGGAILTGALILRRTAISAEETVSTFQQEIRRNEDGRFSADFPEKIEKNGRTYTLMDVIYHERVPDRLSYEAPELKLPADAVFEPERTVSVSGTTYVLESVLEGKQILSGRTARTVAEVRRDERELPAEEAADGTAEVTVVDPETGREETGRIPYARSEEAGTAWQEDLTVRLVFTESDADFFELEGSLYENSGTLPLPEDAYPAILKSLGLSGEENRILSVAWSSEPYLAGTVLCRDAEVKGETLHRFRRDVYEGEVPLPDLTYVIYRARYAESDEDLFRRTEADAEAVYALDPA